MRFYVLLLCIYATLQLPQSTNQSIISSENSTNLEINQRSKRFIPGLTNGLGIASTLGSGVTNTVGKSMSFFQLLGKLVNIAMSEQNLLLKRKCLNLIVRASTFIMKFLPSEPVQQNPQLFKLGGKFKKRKPGFLPKIPVITQTPMSTTESIVGAESEIVYNNIAVEDDSRNISKRSVDDEEDNNENDDLNQFTERDLQIYRKYIGKIDSLVTLIEAGEEVGDEHHIFKRSNDGKVGVEEIKLLMVIVSKMQELVNQHMEKSDDKENENLQEMSDYFQKILEIDPDLQTSTINYAETTTENQNQDFSSMEDNLGNGGEEYKNGGPEVDKFIEKETDKIDEIITSRINEKETSEKATDEVPDIFDEFINKMEKILTAEDDITSLIKKLDNPSSTEIIPNAALNTNKDAAEDITISKENTSSEEDSSAPLEKISNSPFENPQQVVHVEVHKTVTENESSNKTKKPSNLVIIYPEGFKDIVDEIVVTSPPLKVLDKTTEISLSEEVTSNEETTIIDTITEESVLSETYQSTELPDENISELKETIKNHINQEGKYTADDVLEGENSKKVVYVVVHKFSIKNNQSSLNQIDETAKIGTKKETESRAEDKFNFNQNGMTEFLNENGDDVNLEAKLRVKRGRSQDETIEIRSKNTTNHLSNNRNRRQLGTNYFSNVISRFRQISPSFEGFSGSNFHHIPITNNHHFNHYGPNRYPTVFRKEHRGSYHREYPAHTKSPKMQENVPKKEEEKKTTSTINEDHYFNYFPFYERRVNFTTTNSGPSLNSSTTDYIFKSLPHYGNKTDFNEVGYEKVQSTQKFYADQKNESIEVNQRVKENLHQDKVEENYYIFKSLPHFKNKVDFRNGRFESTKNNEINKNIESRYSNIESKSEHVSQIQGSPDKKLENSVEVYNGFNSLPLYKTWNSFREDTGARKLLSKNDQYENVLKAALDNKKKLLEPILGSNHTKVFIANNQILKKTPTNRFHEGTIMNLEKINNLRQELSKRYKQVGFKPVPLTAVVDKDSFAGYLLNDLLPTDEPADTKPWARPSFRRGDIFEGSEEEMSSPEENRPQNSTSNKFKLKWVTVENPQNTNLHRTKLNTTILSFALKTFKETNNRRRFNFTNPILPPWIKPQITQPPSVQTKYNNDFVFPEESMIRKKIVYSTEVRDESPSSNSYIMPNLSVSNEDITKLEHDPPSPHAYELVHSNFGRHFRPDESKGNRLALENGDVLFYDKKPKTAFTSYGVTINK